MVNFQCGCGIQYFYGYLTPRDPSYWGVDSWKEYEKEFGEIPGQLEKTVLKEANYKNKQGALWSDAEADEPGRFRKVDAISFSKACPKCKKRIQEITGKFKTKNKINHQRVLAFGQHIFCLASEYGLTFGEAKRACRHAAQAFSNQEKEKKVMP